MKRINNAKIFKMSIHGIQPKIDTSNNERENTRFNDNQKEAFNAARDSAVKRKIMEFSNKG